MLRPVPRRRSELPTGPSPAVPDGMVWFDEEPTWRKLVDSRLHHPIREFELDILNTDDFGINAELSGKLCGLNLGLELGGTFESNEATHWKIVGECGPLQPPRSRPRAEVPRVRHPADLAGVDDEVIRCYEVSGPYEGDPRQEIQFQRQIAAPLVTYSGSTRT